ncbi:hypothetical protein PRIPAC_95628 [Pristionchus pacificus]|uniref:Uncharacterized protein n=1 Tax=Pristionchus pacificus TaxID=54126 RepID=A0A2A6CV99_PRIPA|nr:hypothetical protein PRIPAC_95628 [Pristionchus pacificus]|eukprot:PDM81951.1 hypothetical protein PRIPAC_34105 [Pristionchus pacificus]
MIGRIIFAFGILQTAVAISCQNQYNYDVPWFAAYKFPKMAGEPSDAADGYGFYYLDSTAKTAFKPSAPAENNTKIYESKIADLAANISGAASVQTGHTKGVLLFDKAQGSGIWLIHSVPKFPPADKHNDEEKTNHCDLIVLLIEVNDGLADVIVQFRRNLNNTVEMSRKEKRRVERAMRQSSILTMDDDEDEIREVATVTPQIAHKAAEGTDTITEMLPSPPPGTVLYYNHPDVYSYRLPDWAAQMAPDLAKVINKQYNNDPSKTKLKQSLAVKGVSTKMDVFAKTHLFNDDLWAGFVAPSYGSLEVETWRRGDLIPTVCNSPNPVFDAQEIKVGGSAQFSYTKDHSKYGRTVDAKNKVVCIGDINRMTSQYSRGGGTVCITDADLWKAYDLIKEIPKC